MLSNEQFISSLDPSIFNLDSSNFESRGDGTNWYIYANNNPLRFIDPTGLIIKDITSVQYQKDPQNRNADIAGRVTGTTNLLTGEFDRNTVGKYGCLLTAITNISNSEIRNSSPYSVDLVKYGNTVAKTASNPDYSDFYTHSDLSTDTFGLDFGTGSEHIQKMLNDTTGTDYSVTRNRDAEESQDIIKEWASDSENSAYIIADVGGHFINITGYAKDEHGNYTLSSVDTSGNNTSYSLDQVQGTYLIEDSTQKELREKVESME